MSDVVVVRVPQINPNDEHAVVVRWHVEKGSRVTAGQTLVTLETTKATFDVDVPSDGYAFFDHEPNAQLAVGAPVAWISDTATAPEKTAPPPSVAAAGGALDRFTRKARKLMRERGLTEADFPGEERVDADAVERAAAREPAPVRPRAPSGTIPLDMPPAKLREIQTLRRVRDEAVPSTVTVAIDSDLLERRIRREAATLGPMSALEVAIYEASRLLREWPDLNGCYADGRAFTYPDVAIGFALNAGHSLRVPVIKNAADLSLRDIAKAVRDLALRYLRAELTIDDLTGGTFTITDLSAEGVVNFVPVLNEQQSAILGLCAARSDGSRDVVLTFDHRLSDGMRAGRFLAALRERLEAGSG